MRNRAIRTAIVAAGLFGAIGTAAPAQADNYTITGWSLPNHVNGRIFAPSLNAAGEGAQIGAINFTGTDTTTNANVTLSVFCIDVADILTTGTFAGYDVATTAPTDASTIATLGYTPAALSNVGYLLNQFSAGAVGNTVKSAALQLAIWEVLNESSANSWNVKSGAFKAANWDSYNLAATGGVDDTANGYLGTLSTALGAPGGIGGFNLTVLQPVSPAPGRNQSQVMALVSVYNPPHDGDIRESVPEPATWGMIVLGFGLLGGALRRGKQKEIFAV